jgi:hypothetical protein
MKSRERITASTKSNKKSSTPKKSLLRRTATLSQEQKTFDGMLASASESVRQTAVCLREVVFSTLVGAVESIYGGGKVGIALYSVGGTNRVICGIQPSRSHCLFYLHRVEAEDVSELKLSGKGKHARHIEFAASRDIPDQIIRCLLKLSLERLK